MTGGLRVVNNRAVEKAHEPLTRSHRDPVASLAKSASAYLLVSLATLFWAGNFVLGRALHETIPPIALSFWRWAVALLILLPFALTPLRRQRILVRRYWAILSLLGVLGVTNFNTFVYLGLRTTSATNALLLQSTTPVLIVAISFLLLREGIGLRQTAGILLSLAGVAAIVTAGDPYSIGSLRLNDGDLWILAAVVSWALYSVCLRWRPAGLDPLAFLAATIAIGLALLAPLYLWDLANGGVFALNAASAGAIAYVAVFPSILAYVFWNQAVEELGPNRTGQFIHLMPAFGILLSIIVLGERPAPFHLVGMGLIAGGILLSTRDPRPGPA